MPFSVRCSSTALFTILLLNFPIYKQSITAAMSIFQLQFPHLLRLWIWRLNIMKFKYDLVARHQADPLFPWASTSMVSDSNCKWCLGKGPTQNVEEQLEEEVGVGRSLITQQECWRLQKQRGLRGEDSWARTHWAHFPVRELQWIKVTRYFKSFPNGCKQSTLKWLRSESCYWSDSTHLHPGSHGCM